MKKGRIFLTIALLSAIAVSCVSSHNKDLKDILAKEKQFADHKQDLKMAVETDNAYRRFILKYPDDTNLPRLIYKDAMLNDYPLRKTTEALNQFETVYSKYPDTRFAPLALMRAAFINETVLSDYNKAKSQYSEFIKKYPDHPLANDAKLSLENIGLTPEQQFQKIQKIQDSIKDQKKIIQ